MNTDTDAATLKPCPFCGSSAKSDNGFSPCESVTYAWCSNQDCSLCTIEFGFTVDEWQARKSPPSKAGSVPCYQCKGCGDNDCAPGRCVRCDGTGIEPNPDMNTTTTKIAGEAMTDEQIIEMAKAHCVDATRISTVLSFARALLASKDAVPWIAHWSGSNPYKGWSIRQGRDEVIWFGETISSETVEGIVLAHNKCFDCDGTGCVMNCSGLRPTDPAQSCGDAEQADEAVTITPAQWADVYYFARASEIGEFVTRAQEVFDAARAKEQS